MAERCIASKYSPNRRLRASSPSATFYPSTRVWTKKISNCFSTGFRRCTKPKQRPARSWRSSSGLSMTRLCRASPKKTNSDNGTDLLAWSVTLKLSITYIKSSSSMATTSNATSQWSNNYSRPGTPTRRFPSLAKNRSGQNPQAASRGSLASIKARKMKIKGRPNSVAQKKRLRMIPLRGLTRPLSCPSTTTRPTWSTWARSRMTSMWSRIRPCASERRASRRAMVATVSS